MDNESLKILDLEANNLTNDLHDRRGIEIIANAIKKNTTLLSLNLNTCNLDEQCGIVLVDAIQENK
jgi:Ran GTPase-activating protein (RanGAP) involved in mRNA processing and transport